MVGHELVVYFNKLEGNVSLVNILDENELMVDEHYFNRYILIEMIKSSGVNFLPGLAVAASEDGVMVDETSAEVGTVVSAVGFELAPEPLAECERFFYGYGRSRV